MTQRDNISKELKELQSSLADMPFQNIYQVPDGYFDGLITNVLNRIKALDASDASEELNHLSPLLSSIPKEMPYTVPKGYFQEMAERIIESGNHLSPAQELETLSPLLSSLKKEMPYSVPQGYFEELAKSVNAKKTKPAAKVVSLTRQKWFRYAAAAIVVGFASMIGFLFIKQDTIDPATQSSEWVKKSVKKISTDEIDEFIQLMDEGTPVIARADASNDIKEKNEIKELIKDIADKDLEDFLEDTRGNESIDDDVLLN
jgi:uncharacterized protein YaaR (DUF327 family)